MDNYSSVPFESDFGPYHVWFQPERIREDIFDARLRQFEEKISKGIEAWICVSDCVDSDVVVDQYEIDGVTYAKTKDVGPSGLYFGIDRTDNNNFRLYTYVEFRDGIKYKGHTQTCSVFAFDKCTPTEALTRIRALLKAVRETLH